MTHRHHGPHPISDTVRSAERTRQSLYGGPEETTMEHDERTTLLRIALAAQALLDRLDHMTPEAFSRGGERQERDALRQALGRPEPCALPTATRCHDCGGPLDDAEQAYSRTAQQPPRCVYCHLDSEEHEKADLLPLETLSTTNPLDTARHAPGEPLTISALILWLDALYRCYGDLPLYLQASTGDAPAEVCVEGEIRRGPGGRVVLLRAQRGEE